MPSEPSVHQHRWQAQHNEDLLNQTSLPPDWEVTVRFYAVAHWVRAYLKKALGVPHIRDHQETDRLLHQAKIQRDIIQLFRDLRHASEDARYYCVQPTPGVLDKMRKAHQRLRFFFEPKTRQ
jgi:hypothetical protein